MGTGTSWSLETLLRQQGAPTPTAQGSFLRAPGRGRPGSSWHRAEQGPRVPSAPAPHGLYRPCRRLLAGSVSHAPVCRRPLHPPLTPSHLSQSSPKSPKPPPARRCLAAVWVFPGCLPRGAEAQASKGSTILAGPFQLGVFSDAMTASSREGTSVLHSHYPHPEAAATSRDAHTDGMGWTDRTPSDATTFGTALAQGTEQHTLLVTSKSPSPEIIYIGKIS